MNKNAILNDFLKLKEEGVIVDSFSTFDELLDVLSDMFAEEVEDSSDAQEAYDNLNDALGGIIEKHCGVYSLGTKDWSIECSTDNSKELISQLIQKWNDYYDDKITDIDELCSSLTRRVGKDMCNAGCDVHNALSMISDDVFVGKHPFFVELGEKNPRISFLD